MDKNFVSSDRRLIACRTSYSFVYLCWGKIPGSWNQSGLESNTGFLSTPFDGGFNYHSESLWHVFGFTEDRGNIISWIVRHDGEYRDMHEHIQKTGGIYFQRWELDELANYFESSWNEGCGQKTTSALIPPRLYRNMKRIEDAWNISWGQGHEFFYQKPKNRNDEDQEGTFVTE